MTASLISRRAALLFRVSAIHTAACFFVGASLLYATGCGSSQRDLNQVPVYPATGTITFKGQPTPGAFVTLHPKSPLPEGAPSPRATVKPDGGFAATTYEAGDGAPEGEYILTVQWYKPIQKDGDLVAGPNVIPKQYTNPKTSKLEVRVAAGENQLEPIKL